MSKIIERNTNVPVSRTRTFTTESDQQTTVEVQVYEGERPLTKDNRLLGHFYLNVRPAPRGVAQIEVTFTVDVDNILSVTAVDKATSKTEQLVMQNDRGRLSKTELDHLVAEAKLMEEEDRKVKEDIEARTLFENDVYRLRGKLLDPENLRYLKKSEKTLMEEALKSAFTFLDEHPNPQKPECERERDRFKRQTDPVASRFKSSGFGGSE